MRDIPRGGGGTYINRMNNFCSYRTLHCQSPPERTCIKSGVGRWDGCGSGRIVHKPQPLKRKVSLRGSDPQSVCKPAERFTTVGQICIHFSVWTGCIHLCYRYYILNCDDDEGKPPGRLVPVSKARVWSRSSKERAHLLWEVTTEQRSRPLCQCSRSLGAQWCVPTTPALAA